jgi:GTP-binding protein
VTSLASTADLERFAKHSRKMQFAFVGKSNVGKSSLINHLAQNKNLAKVSSTPGKTQLVNIFEIAECIVVDLPGYGFAKVSKEIKYNWNLLMQSYFDIFYNTLQVFILIDPKKPISQEDFDMIDLCLSRTIPFAIIFTKIDQIPKTHLEKTLKPRLKELQDYFQTPPSFILYSTESTQGRDALISLIEDSLNQGKEEK